jgi:hypothetical protein
MAGPRPDRPLFSPGQYVGAGDLNDIVDYARDGQRRQQLSGACWGIGVGLALIERPAQGSAVEMWIEPGVAWDGYGRLILVSTPALVSPDLFSGFAGSTTTPIAYPVWLRYQETPQPPSASGSNGCSTSATTFIGESYVVQAGRITHFTDQQSGITIGGASVPDPRDMLRVVDQNAAVVLDGAAAHQTFPADADDPFWLVPVGLALWDGSNFVARSTDQLTQSRAYRRYVGTVAESVLAADGVLRLRDRQTDLPPGLNEDQLDQNNAIQPTDLQVDTQTGRCVGNELVWVEGSMRVTGDARLWGTKLEFRDGSGGDRPLHIRRGASANSQGGQDLQVVIGQNTTDGDRLTVGPVVSDLLQEQVTVQSDGEVRIAGPLNVGSTSDAPRTLLDVSASIAGQGGGKPPLVDHVAIIENQASSQASVLALKMGISEPPPDYSSNYITFFDSKGAIGSIKPTGQASPSTNTYQVPSIISTNSFSGPGVTLITNSADFAECLPRARNAAPIGPGRIVGAFAGCVSLATDGADSLLVTTDRPAVLGNAPPQDEAAGFEAVALIGQVAIVVEGPVKAGDLILPSGRADGCGRAVSPAALAVDDLTQIVGRAWESSDIAAPKRVNAIVGTGANAAHGLAAMLAVQSETIRALSAELARLRQARDG